MRIPASLTRMMVLLAAILMFAIPAQAEEMVTGAETTESINRILRKIEEMAGVLALNKSLDEEQTRQFIDDLAQLHSEVRGLKQANEILLDLARQGVSDQVQQEQPGQPAAGTSPGEGQPAATEVQEQQAPPAAEEAPPVETPAEDPAQETPATDPETAGGQDAPAQPDTEEPGTTPPLRDFGVWEPYLDFQLVVDPEGSEFNGWVAGSSIDQTWGEAGQMVLNITNGYTTNWTISNAYFGGSAKVTVSPGPQGEIIIQVRDEEGLHEFSIRNGGLGPIFHRWVEEVEVEGNPA